MESSLAELGEVEEEQVRGRRLSKRDGSYYAHHGGTEHSQKGPCSISSIESVRGGGRLDAT